MDAAEGEGPAPPPRHEAALGYARDPGVVEDQLKVARLPHPAGAAFGGAHGHEYGKDRARGPEVAVELSRGDVLYFLAGMWHRVKTRSGCCRK